MNLPKNIIFHRLNGIRGWSECILSVIDVARVQDISYRKRHFCIFDKQCPYQLEILYSVKTDKLALIPVVTSGAHIGFGMQRYTSRESYITKRYSSEQECQNEITEIHKKQKKLEYMIKDLVSKMHDFVEKS